MRCRKHDIDIGGCSRIADGAFRTVCTECNPGPFIPPAGQYPWRRDRAGRPNKRKVRGECCLCSKPVYDNVDSSKAITCGLCVQKLLGMSQEAKAELRDKLIELERFEASRCVESFITGQGVKGTIATREKTPKKNHSTPINFTGNPIKNISTLGFLGEERP